MPEDDEAEDDALDDVQEEGRVVDVDGDAPPSDEEEGEDLLENMEQDYAAIAELDHYDETMLDKRTYADMGVDQRRLVEGRLIARDLRDQGAEAGLHEYDDDDEDIDQREKRKLASFAQELLRGDVADFSESYVELLALKGVSVPQLDDDRVPLQTLPRSNQDVYSEAMTGVLLDMETTPLKFERELEKLFDGRSMEARERIRCIDERKLHKQQVGKVSAFFSRRSWKGLAAELLGTLLVLWLCYMSTRLDFIWRPSPQLSLLVALPMARFVLKSVATSLAVPLALPVGTPTRDVYAVFGGAYLQSRALGSVLAHFGKSLRLPLVERLELLEDGCVRYLDQWRVRMAARNMQESLKRGRITHNGLLLLMDDLAASGERRARASPSTRHRFKKHAQATKAQQRKWARSQRQQSFSANKWAAARMAAEQFTHDDSDYEDEETEATDGWASGKIPGSIDDVMAFLDLPVNEKEGPQK